MTAASAGAVRRRRRSGLKRVVGNALLIKLSRTAVTCGNIAIGQTGLEYFSNMDDTFDVVSKWGTEYARRVAGVDGLNTNPIIHLSRTFMRRFEVGDLVRFELVSRSVVRMSLVEGA